MSEAIERVIAILDKDRELAETAKKYAIEDYDSGACSGRYVGYTRAICLLKEVLSLESTKTSTEPTGQEREKS